MPLSHWPESERPREKLLKLGAAALSEAELLAILLRTGTPGHSAIDMARGLLSEFRSLRGLLTAERHAVCRVRGLGSAKYALAAGLARTVAPPLRGADADGPGARQPAGHAGVPEGTPARPGPLFCCLFLDNRHRVICFVTKCSAARSTASVHPRDVVKLALARNAAAVILAHNHPSGIAEPSQADELITGRLREALALVDIRVLDHIVVGDGACVSFAERGLL
jgi:DNA repair protein RadC